MDEVTQVLVVNSVKTILQHKLERTPTMGELLAYIVGDQRVKKMIYHQYDAEFWGHPEINSDAVKERDKNMMINDEARHGK